MPTHGSVTKAGKVRAQTPRIDSEERSSPPPRQRNRRNFHKRVMLNRRIGQFNSRRRGRRRRR